MLPRLLLCMAVLGLALVVWQSLMSRRAQMNAVGSTGDHIGVNTGEINKDYLTNKHTEVKAQQVDDLVMSLGKGVYMVKIDVQGHEVLVLEGMRKALAARKVLYVMLEFWPRAIKTTSKRAGEEVRVAVWAPPRRGLYSPAAHCRHNACRRWSCWRHTGILSTTRRCTTAVGARTHLVSLVARRRRTTSSARLLSRRRPGGTSTWMKCTATRSVARRTCWRLRLWTITSC